MKRNKKVAEWRKFRQALGALKHFINPEPKSEERKVIEALLEFAKKHHAVCGYCDGTGKIYNNADPTSGQWVYCKYVEAIRVAEKYKGHKRANQGPRGM